MADKLLYFGTFLLLAALFARKLLNRLKKRRGENESPPNFAPENYTSGPTAARYKKY
jgi:hypothetical protein